MKFLLIALTSILLNSQGASAQEKITEKDPHQIKNPHDTATLRKLSKEAIDKGVNYLIKTQNKDGSWGSGRPELTKLSDFGFSQLNKGGHHGVRLACTSICASALLALPERTDPQERALQRAIQLLLKPVTIPFQNGQTFNVWGYAYQLDFMAQLANSPFKQQHFPQIQKTVTHCLDKLASLQQHEGGWMYYSSTKGTKRASTSFTTGIILNAMIIAQKNGCKISKKLEKDALRVILSMRTLDNSFHYSTDHIKSRYSRTRSIGTASRTIVCSLALLEAGSFTKKQAQQGLDLFNQYDRFLEETRKHTRPHAGSENNASYYYYFGYNYASSLAVKLNPKQKIWDKYAWSILRNQEKDGRWWDTPCGEYGSKWGTGFAIQTLLRYLK